MADIALQTAGARGRRANLSLRWRVVLILWAVVVTSFVAGAVLVYRHAEEERHAIAHQAVAAAVTTATAIDREVAAMAYLLKGLSRSPALKAGDHKAFYDQLIETPRPQGSWFVLWNMERQLLNTRRPFGTRLATFAEAGVQEVNVNRLRDRGVAISELTVAPVVKEAIIAVSLRLDGADGQMIGILTAVLPATSLNAVAREGPQAPGWTTTVLDRKLAPITQSGAGTDLIGHQLHPAVRERLLQQPAHGYFTIQDGGEENLVAVHRSAATDYTTVTTVPPRLANAPMDAALRRIGSAGIVLLLAGALAGFVVVRQVGPIERSAAMTARRLRLAEARYKSLWADTPESLFVVTVRDNGRFVFEGLNPAHERATGLAFEAIAGKEPEECLAPETAATVLKRYRHCVATGKPQIYDEVLDLPTGRRYWQTSLSPVKDPETDRIILLVGTARDVTEDREARARAEQSQGLLQATLDALSAHIAILDETGTIIAVNRAWHRFAEAGGYRTPDHGIGRNYLAVCLSAVTTDRHVVGVADGLKRVLGGEGETFKASYECRDSSFQMSMARFCFAGTVHVVVAHEDITDLRSAQQDARDIASRLLSLQEEERQRIAADLHDSTAQHIVAAGLGLMNVGAVAGGGSAVEDAIRTVRSSLDEAQKEIRTLSYLLYPPELRRHGLAASIRHFVDGFSRRTGLKGRATVSPAVDTVPLEIQQSVLRVVQEALVNVHRHAEATKVAVDVGLHAKELRLLVKDDGKGLPAKNGGVHDTAPALGVGIPGMEARMRQFGGTLDLTSGAQGTTIRAVIPLAEEAARPAYFPAAHLRVSHDGQWRGTR